MKCLNCDVENKPDALYCRRCGNCIKKCITCGSAHEDDAVYCRRCGNPTDSLQANYAEPTDHKVTGGRAVHSADFDSDLDFTTKVSPKRVERIPNKSGLRRVARAAAHIVIVLILAASVTAVIVMWRSTQALRPELAKQGEELKANLEEFKEINAETKDAERRAILEEIRLVLAEMREEERKATNEEIKRAVSEAREKDRKTLSGEIAKAVSKSRMEDHRFIVAELTKLKTKTKNREFARHIERIINVFKMGGNLEPDARRELARGKS